jgi:thioredoxin reductase
MSTKGTLPVAVIGGGPIGLAAAAHLIARGETPILFEVGDTIAHSVRQWAHVPMFSPWEFNLDSTAASLLERSSWRRPPTDVIPTGGELVAEYLAPLASLPALRGRVHLGACVTAVARKGYDKVRTAGRFDQPFVLRVTRADGRDDTVEAKAVIDASGTWRSPNPAGADGYPAIGEVAAAERIFYGIPDVLGLARRRYAGRTTMVVGSGHSALNAVIELGTLKQDDPSTRVIWALRKDNISEAFGGEAADALPARGALGIQARKLCESGAVETVSPFRIAKIAPARDLLTIIGELSGCEKHIQAHELIVATGFRPDFSYLREMRLTVDPWLESSGEIGPLIDPNLHSCGTVRPHGAQQLAHAEPGFFIVGMKSYGRAPTFLLATGHEQVRSVVAEIAGDRQAACEVHLVLPETGVCRITPLVAQGQSSSCCGGPAEIALASCCAEDERAKASGETGCGCG